MTLDKIKQINIQAYLEQMNIYPVKDYGYYGMYHCPYREDRNASFKVDYSKNIWYDFGTNKGGSIIDLVIRLDSCSFNDAVRKLDDC
jgi:DNA primase